MAEWLKASVSKTEVPVRVPWVRIPPCPPSCFALTRFAGLALLSRAKQGVRYVYLLESIDWPGQRYVGQTTDLKRRLADHNAGKSPHPSQYLPWRLVTYVAFSDEAQAHSFERYLKSGSGHAFTNKRLW